MTSQSEASRFIEKADAFIDWMVENDFQVNLPLRNKMAEVLQEAYQRGVKDSADIVDRFVKDPYTSDTATECENARNAILSLLSLTPKGEE